MGKHSLYRAFDQEKTPKEWSEAPRCVVNYVTLMGRLQRGWPTEAALVLPDTGPKGFLAFGRRKTLIKWLTDPRCKVPATVLLKRLEEKWTLERALTVEAEFYPAEPVPEKRRLFTKPEDPKRLYEAFGEQKRLIEWARDARSPVKYSGLKRRLKSGLDLESALVFTEEELSSTHWCFGLPKRMGVWLRDPRRVASAEVIKERLSHGERLEHAITRPDGAPLPAVAAPDSDVEAVARQFATSLLTINGETKTIRAWSLDPRCEVTGTTLSRRVKVGWPRDARILKIAAADSPLKRQFEGFDSAGNFLGRFRNVKIASEAVLARDSSGKVVGVYSGEEWPVPKLAKPHSAPRPKRVRSITAWGETKRGPDWLLDPRCKVGSIQLLYRRLDSAKEWTPEAALATPPKPLFMSELKKVQAKKHRALGESKTLLEWCQDPRCELTYNGLRTRLQRGETLEQILIRGRRR